MEETKTEIMRIILLSLLCLPLIVQAQFIFEKVDSVAKTKNQLYSDTKMFIAETWKSSKTVIENDDKEAGIIFIKGATELSVIWFTDTYFYIYEYNVTFRMKDSKYKITINNVSCSSANLPRGVIQPSKIQPFEGNNCPQVGTMIPNKKALELMEKLKINLSAVIDNYSIYIQKPSASDDW